MPDTKMIIVIKVQRYLSIRYKNMLFISEKYVLIDKTDFGVRGTVLVFACG